MSFEQQVMKKAATKSHQATNNAAPTSAPEGRRFPVETSPSVEEFVVIECPEYPGDEWIDRVAVLQDPRESRLLGQFRDAANNLGSRLGRSIRWEDPVRAKKDAKAASDFLRTMGTVITTLDRLRRGTQRNIIVIRDPVPRVGGGLDRSCEDLKLDQSDQLLDDYMASSVDQLHAAAGNCRNRARELHSDPPSPPQSDERGRPIGRDRTDWEDRFIAVANRFIREASKLESFLLARSNRGTQVFRVVDRHSTKSKSGRKQAASHGVRKRRKRRATGD